MSRESVNEVRRGVLIIGAGQAAHQLAVSLREEGFVAPVVIVGDELHPPYQRPPLSKSFLTAQSAYEQLYFAPSDYYASLGIELRSDCRIIAVNRESKFATNLTGELFPYDHLVFATGARSRELPQAAKLPPGSIVSIRDIKDAELVKSRITQAKRVVVIGGGFLGLEFACVAAARGCEVVVVEAGKQLLGRAIRPVVAERIREIHEQSGIRIRLSSVLEEIRPSGDGNVLLELSDGSRLEADLIIAAIGVTPNTELASDCGLTVSDGIVVDTVLATSDPCVSAIGDCTRFVLSTNPSARLESVPSAVAQAKYLARRLTDAQQEEYDDVPWFWSDQGALRLHIVGLTTSADEVVVTGDLAASKFAALCFKDGAFIGLEAVNSFADYRAARKILESRAHLHVQQVRQPGFDIRNFTARMSQAD